jgi:hypothetical protein
MNKGGKEWGGDEGESENGDGGKREKLYRQRRWRQHGDDKAASTRLMAACSSERQGLTKEISCFLPFFI